LWQGRLIEEGPEVGRVEGEDQLVAGEAYRRGLEYHICEQVVLSVLLQLETTVNTDRNHLSMRVKSVL